MVLAAIIAAPIMLVRSCFFSTAEGSEDDDPMARITPEMVRHDSLVALRVDSIMNIPQRLDTANIAISIFDATTGLQVYSRHADQELPPASCMKVATAIAALRTLGFDHRFCESIQMRGAVKTDTLHGNLLLRADADPLLESFDDLVSQLKRTGIKHIDGNVYLDLALDTVLDSHPSTKTWDIPYHKLPPLLRGRNFVERTFIYTLRANGITYKRNPRIRPAEKYRVVAQTSHSLRDVITPMLIHSSNIKAETVFYHLDWKAGMAKDHRQHWDVKHVLEDYLVSQFSLFTDTTAIELPESDRTSPKGIIKDGSGLSPQNRLTANFLVELLKYAYEDGQLHDYFINEALASPCDGERRGSLLSRFGRPEYANRIFVKTGTLTTIGASSLSGYIHSYDNHWYIFSIINTDSPVAESRIFQDRLCKEIIKSRPS